MINSGEVAKELQALVTRLEEARRQAGVAKATAHNARRKTESLRGEANGAGNAPLLGRSLEHFSKAESDTDRAHDPLHEAIDALTAYVSAAFQQGPHGSAAAGPGAPQSGRESAQSVASEPDPPSGASYATTLGRPLYGAKGIALEVPQQGYLGDCFLIASICAVAGSEPQTVQSLVSETAEGDVIVGSTVMSRDLPVQEGKTYGRSADGSTWVGLIEKAFAASRGGYPRIDNGGWPREALEWLTGRQAMVTDTNGTPDMRLSAVLSSGRPTVAISRQDSTGALAYLGDRYEVVANHAYAVRGLDADGRVLLHNPWGFRHPLPIPFEDFRKLFSEVDSC